MRGREPRPSRAVAKRPAVFGLSLVVHVPATAREFRPASCGKPLFDGTLAAWHAHDDSNGAEVARRVAAQTAQADADLGNEPAFAAQ